jgi:hypothetical protein
MAATDDFSAFQVGLRDPGVHAATVTPDDNTDLGHVTRALYVGGAGAVAVIMNGGESVTFSGVTAGTFLPLRVNRVKATGTTATNIVAIW